MPIVFTAILPHPPLLIPSIGKDNLRLLEKTLTSYKKIEQEFYVSHPDTLVVISPHGHIHNNAFSINLHPKFTVQFEEFGDFSIKKNFQGDVMLAHRIRESLETIPLQLQSYETLDHGTSVPLFLLSEHLPKLKVIPIYHSGQDLKAHFEFGQLTKKELYKSKERIAIVASGDLSHTLSKKSPAGYSPKSKKFDKKVIDYLLEERKEDFLDLDPQIIDEVCACGLKSIAVLLGIIDGTRHKKQLLSYEAPFGVGYMAMRIAF